MTRTQLSIHSWNRFKTRSLVVLPDLLGLHHDFSFEEHSVRVKLPGPGDIDREKGLDSRLSVGARRAIDHEPLEYHVHSVDVGVRLPCQVNVPSAVLNRPPKAHDLFSEKEQHQLNKTARRHRWIAEQAFDLWIRMIRWKCDDSSIGRPEVHDFQSGWSTYLIDNEMAKRIWAESTAIFVQGYKTINRETWIEIGNALSLGRQPPIYHELKHDAEMHIDLGKLDRAAVELAIAAETYLRSAVLGSLPPTLDEAVRDFIAGGKINEYWTNFFPALLDEDQLKEYQPLKSGLEELFAARNKLTHGEQANGLTKDKCRKFLRLTKQLLSFDVC